MMYPVVDSQHKTTLVNYFCIIFVFSVVLVSFRPTDSVELMLNSGRVLPILIVSTQAHSTCLDPGPCERTRSDM